MKTRIFLGILVALLTGRPAIALDTNVDSKQKHESSHSIHQSTTFVISNPDGNVRLVESNSDQVEVVYSNQTNQSANISVTSPAPGKMKIEGKAKNSGSIQFSGSGSSISISGGSIRISGGARGVTIGNISGGSTSIIGGRVFVDGQEITPQGSDQGALIGTTDLEVRVPKDFLAHAQLDANGDIGILGEFEGPLSTERIVKAKTSQGTVTCVGLCALADLNLHTSQGDIEMRDVKGVVMAKTSQGSVSAAESEGSLTLITSQGSINGRNNSGDIDVKTSQGSVRITGQKNGSVIAKTSMGSIYLDNPLATRENAKSSMGSVRLTPQLNAAACADLMVGKKPRDPFDF